MAGGLRCSVEGEAEVVERAILDAARGSIMQLAWLVDADSSERLGVNPVLVVAIRAVGS